MALKTANNIILSLSLTAILVQSIEPKDDPNNEGLGDCTLNSDVYMFCEDIEWSESNADEYDKCVQRHNGYLNEYAKPPVPDDCTGGKSCLYCQQKLANCECQCYDSCDGAYLIGMQLLSAFLTMIVCIFCIYLGQKKKNQPPKMNMTKEQMDSLINCDVSAKIDAKPWPYSGKIMEVKNDENEDEMMFRINFHADEMPDKWMKQNEIRFDGDHPFTDEEESWKFWLPFLVCLVCAIFAIILWFDPLVFYPETETKSQTEKFDDWGIAFVVFGSVGGCCCLLCACGAGLQMQIDKEEREKKEKNSTTSNDIELEHVDGGDNASALEEKRADEKGNDVTVKVWIFRTIAFGICSTVFLIVGSLMMEGAFVNDD